VAGIPLREIDFQIMNPDHQIFLGVDIGGTKTRALLCDADGAVLGFGKAGPGNHETVGYPGLTAAIRVALDQACAQAKVSAADIGAAGFGIGGLDWDSQVADTRDAIRKAGLSCLLRMVNDTILGLMAGAPEGWGIAVVSGTGCNCWGWNKDRSRIGRVTGGSFPMGEGAGATELMAEAVKAVSRSWTKRGPATALADVLVQSVGAKDIPDLLDGLMNSRYSIETSTAPLVFQTAAAGDPVAAALVDWAGAELGEMVSAVARQLDFQDLEFDVVMVGSMFDGGPVLQEAMRRRVEITAPRSRFLRLACPPVVGAALLAMELVGIQPSQGVRKRLAQETIAHL
jgi:N-acetylglucosamine kinase-like BadF-type ATPase